MVATVAVALACGCRTRLPADDVEAPAPTFDLAIVDEAPPARIDCKAPRVLRWTPGWDVFTAPFDPIESTVSWCNGPGARDVTVRYHVAGGAPNSGHVVGIAHFQPQPRCLVFFGGRRAASCLIPCTREGI